MPKYIRNSGKQWSQNEVAQLTSLAQANTPTRVIGLKLGRPVAGIQAKASEVGVSLKPPNRHPYSRRKA